MEGNAYHYQNSQTSNPNDSEKHKSSHTTMAIFNDLPADQGVSYENSSLGGHAPNPDTNEGASYESSSLGGHANPKNSSLGGNANPNFSDWYANQEAMYENKSMGGYANPTFSDLYANQGVSYENPNPNANIPAGTNYESSSLGDHANPNPPANQGAINHES